MNDARCFCFVVDRVCGLHEFGKRRQASKLNPPMKLRRLWPLGLILVVYLVVGGLFATRIPAWQSPDEPAHYNYVRQLAQTGAMPIIEPSDWTPGLVPIGPDNRSVPVERLTYEDHQPVLFYALSVPVFRLSNGSLVALRLFALLLSSLTVVFTFLTVQTIFPTQTSVAAFAAAFVAFLPQHVHIMASYNNDALSEALLAITVFLCVRLILQSDQHTSERTDTSEVSKNFGSVRVTLRALTVVVGLALLTKAQAYLTLPLAIIGLWMAYRNTRTSQVALSANRPGNPASTLRMGPAWVVPIVACLIGAPLWLRNITLYGGLDFLGLQRHNAVVIGQPTTAALIAKLGLGGALSKLLRVTFQSFWGQFGWMSITLSDRFYLGFLAFTLISASLFGLWWLRTQSQKAHTPAQNKALTLLACLAGMTVLAFAWYNLQFEQHQGRYLYPALISIATAISLGWHFTVRKFLVLHNWLWLIFTIVFAAMDVYLLLRVILPQMKA